ncbi:MAG: AAA family ATPase [Bacteroidales bacterium]|nr:AAA family ATPase [Bacteroidales bacterium]
MYNEDKLNEAIKGLSENHLLRLNEFAFEKLVHLWDEWKEKTINSAMLDKLIGLEYQDFLNLANEDASVNEIKDLIFRIVAYCDLNANNKAVLNEYDDKRTIAKCGIRQNAWVAQLLKFKKDVNLVKDSLINVIQYIENPENHYPIVSEEHKKCIYNYFIGDGKYSKDTFGDSLNMFFDGKTNFQFAKPSNKTNLYSDIIYAIKDEWMEKPQIEGVFACDSNDWKVEFIEGIEKQKYGCMTWDKNFVNYRQVYPKLQQAIDEKGFFEFYIVENYKAIYKARVIDFATSKKSYEERAFEWGEKSPLWFYENYEDYDRKNIIMLVDSFIKLDNPIDIKLFVTYQNASFPIRNNVVAFTKIIDQTTTEMNNFISETTKILKLKKNIILQGAPGTGKTYNTAALALSILGVDTTALSHDEIMKEYDKLLEKQIFFTTFHQSMDYEDFVEGIKPEVLNNGIGVKYNVEDGILKKAINRPLETFLDASKNIEYKTVDGNGFCIQKYENDKIFISCKKNSNINWISFGFVDKAINEFPNNEITNGQDFAMKIQGKSNDQHGDNQTAYAYALYKEYIEWRKKPKVIIIDEINRGNVSKIFGELITLVEADKRIGSSNENNHHLSVILPYSKRSFGIPANVYFIGTMNTTDRSTGTIDYALRRRFAFVTLTSNREILNSIKDDSAREFALQKFDIVKDFIVNNKTSDFDIDDLMVGHSYFLSESVDELRIKLKYEVVPLLKEYMKDGIIRNNEETKRFVMSLLD